MYEHIHGPLSPRDRVAMNGRRTAYLVLTAAKMDIIGLLQLDTSRGIAEAGPAGAVCSQTRLDPEVRWRPCRVRLGSTTTSLPGLPRAVRQRSANSLKIP